MIIPTYGRTNKPSYMKFLGRDFKYRQMQDIKRLLAQGYSQERIADWLGLSSSRVSLIVTAYGLK